MNKSNQIIWELSRLGLAGDRLYMSIIHLPNDRQSIFKRSKCTHHVIDWVWNEIEESWSSSGIRKIITEEILIPFYLDKDKSPSELAQEILNKIIDGNHLDPDFDKELISSLIK